MALKAGLAEEREERAATEADFEAMGDALDGTEAKLNVLELKTAVASREANEVHAQLQAKLRAAEATIAQLQAALDAANDAALDEAAERQATSFGWVLASTCLFAEGLARHTTLFVSRC